MNTHKGLRVAGVALVVALMTGASGATSASSIYTSRINYLTFNGTVALPGVTLPAGSYAFELAASSGGFEVVRVSRRDGGRMVFTGLTVPVERPGGFGQDASVVFGERNVGEPLPITVWFPARSDRGHRFIYK